MVMDRTKGSGGEWALERSRYWGHGHGSLGRLGYLQSRPSFQPPDTLKAVRPSNPPAVSYAGEPLLLDVSSSFLPLPLHFPTLPRPFPSPFLALPFPSPSPFLSPPFPSPILSLPFPSPFLSLPFPAPFLP